MRIAWASTVGIISNIVLIASVVVLIVEIRQNQVSMLAQSSYERTQMSIANDQALVKDAQKKSIEKLMLMKKLPKTSF